MHKDILDIKNEKTFVMIKPDGVQRWLVGEIVRRFENKWLTLESIRIAQPKKEDVYKHYPSEDNEWITRLWHKSLGTFEQANIDPKKHLGTWDPTEIGKKVLDFLVDYISSWRCVMMIRSWANVLDTARKLVGWTIPANADIGTIRW
jgi:nucleoside-diphosphate kinase